MPKYSISGKYSLKDTLQAMGVVSAFSDTADFSAMTTDSVKLSKVGLCFENTTLVSRLHETVVLKLLSRKATSTVSNPSFYY